MKIKDWVDECLKDTQDAEQIWRSCQDRFPHNKVSWGYVRKLVRARLASDQGARENG